MQIVIDVLEAYSMKTRIITGLLLASVLVPALFIGGIFLHAIIGLLVTIGSYEIVRIFKTKWPSYTLWLFPFLSLINTIKQLFPLILFNM